MIHSLLRLSFLVRQSLLADLVQGKNVAFQFVPNGVDERYLRMNYTVAGSGCYDWCHLVRH